MVGRSPAYVVLALSLVLCACGRTGDDKPAAPPAPKVVFTRVVRKDVPMFTETVATLDGYVNAEIRARVRGYLSTQEYKEGSVVKENQKLFSIERTQYQAAVA